MKRLIIKIVSLAVILTLICLIYRIGTKNVYVDYIPIPPEYDETDQMRLEMFPPDGTPGHAPEDKPQQGGSMRFEILDQNEDYIKIAGYPEKSGKGEFGIVSEKEGTGEPNTIHIGPARTVYNEETGGFTGDNLTLICITIFLLATAAMMARYTFSAKGAAFYSYFTIYTAGFSFFCFAVGIEMLILTIDRLMDPAHHMMREVYWEICGISAFFVVWMTPFIVVFSIAMAISNIELLRHEAKRVQNVLGLAIGLVLILGNTLMILMVNMPFFSLSMRTRVIIENVSATAFAYFECMLLGAIVCGIRAVYQKPEKNADFLVILGCGFRKDGSLSPLLKGRVDRAVAFYEEQKEESGKEAVFVPSGGQGSDEPMSESEAMARYLKSRGFDDSQILKEDQSKNTFQNMQFSRRLIEERKKDAKVVFSTTNYHVFRSGVWANLAGLKTEGIGSRTKWWFWPNAFMRECIGLLVNRWKQELAFLLSLTGFFALLTILLE